MLANIIIGDTCSIENLYHGDMLQWTNIVFDITQLNILQNQMSGLEKKMPKDLELIGKNTLMKL